MFQTNKSQKNVSLSSPTLKEKQKSDKPILIREPKNEYHKRENNLGLSSVPLERPIDGRTQIKNIIIDIRTNINKIII
jgi:hypothetical protein